MIHYEKPKARVWLDGIEIHNVQYVRIDGVYCYVCVNWVRRRGTKLLVEWNNGDPPIFVGTTLEDYEAGGKIPAPKKTISSFLPPNGLEHIAPKCKRRILL